MVKELEMEKIKIINRIINNKIAELKGEYMMATGIRKTNIGIEMITLYGEKIHYQNLEFEEKQLIK